MKTRKEQVARALESNRVLQGRRRKRGLEGKVSPMAKNAKKIAKELAKRLRKLDRKGDLAEDGKKVATAINNLRAERQLSSEKLNRRATI